MASQHGVANEVMEDLDASFEPGATLLLPRIFNFFKRQTSATTASLTAASSSEDPTEGTTKPAGTTDRDSHTAVMAPNYESYGFASEGGPDTALTAIREKA